MSCVTNNEQGNSQQLSQDLRQWSSEENQEIKLLLLGAGASGKSTFFKQMKLLHANGFTENDKLGFKTVIMNNVKEIFTTVIFAAERFECALGKDFVEIVEYMKTEKNNTQPFVVDVELAKKLLALWKDEGFQKTIVRRNEFDCYDSTDYFDTRLTDIGDKEYIPTIPDILHSRSKTVGIMTQKIEILQENKRKQRFLFVDVGGQRNERKKWIHAFDQVTAVIFFTSLCEYDQVLEEDKKRNRVEESLDLLKMICTEKAFKNVAMIIFYNKDDLFREKIKLVDPGKTEIFADYKGGKDYDKAMEYFKGKFKSQNGDKGRTVQEHITTATDTQNVKKVFESCKAIILRQLLKKSGF